MSAKEYLFTSERLGFRNWEMDDLDAFGEMCADPVVMEHFPATLTREETSVLIQRLKDHFDQYGYTYFATEVLTTGEFIGFIGLAKQEYDAPFNPATDIGWRLMRTAWGKGYATEGAQRCLAFAFQDLQIKRIVAVCTRNNSKSEHVMIKIGMTKQGEFNHPKLSAHPDLERCIWYEVESP